jgi:heptosyltransferase-2
MDGRRVKPIVGWYKVSPPPRVAVMQPLPGIGDMIWHLPHIRAIAQHAGTAVTLLAKPRSAADQLFTGEPTVRDVIWIDRNRQRKRGHHDGPLGLWHLISELRSHRFDAIYLLHHSRMLAFAAMAAGIPARFGYGFGMQRQFLNRPPFLSPEIMRLHQFERASAFLRAANIHMSETAPHLAVVPAARAAVAARIAGLPRPLVAIGIGSSEPSRQWGQARFTLLSEALLQANWPTLAFVGGPQDAASLAEILAALADHAPRTLAALGWHLTEVAALLSEAAFYVGNTTGPMNMAAAVGIRTYSLFGTTPTFHHSPQIVPVVSPPGPDDGMARVTVEAVLATMEADRGTLGPHAAGVA